MKNLEPKLFVYLITIILVVIIFIRMKIILMINNLKKKTGVRFYYKFLGNIEWLKKEILRGKYLEMKYLNAVDNKNNSNITILLEKKEENSIVNIYSPNHNNIIIKNLRLDDEKFKEFIEFLPITLVENDFVKE